MNRPNTALEQMAITLLRLCITTAASIPPVRQVTSPAAAANTARSSKAHGCTDPWSTTNSRLDSVSGTSQASNGLRNQPPTFSTGQARKGTDRPPSARTRGGAAARARWRPPRPG
ncbi:hypothetical protein CGZ93_16555 [Enemella dayhoffiae]|uniref:Uncharacterized protein n=1 Tax=Enemella dayhoffiae TaxID=2016507 RepID=A0A255GRE9_9ACTN|nr:hypothetical protein CGZ93_16555 [Enemella dayhoffiae]